MKRALLVIAKHPQPGQTKTRLTPALSAEQASQLYDCFLRDTLALARAVPGVTPYILYSPAHQAAYFAGLAPDFALLAQNGSSLGERLDNALTYCLNDGFDQVVVMNSDGPTLPAHYLEQAFKLLETSEAVFGPSEDGGYYLVGLTRPQPRLLREVQMSTPSVLQDTLALARLENVKVSLLPTWYDIDTIDDLDRMTHELEAQSTPSALHSYAYLKRLRHKLETKV